MFNWAEDNDHPRTRLRGRRQAGQNTSCFPEQLPGKPGDKGPIELSVSSQAERSGRACGRGRDE